VAQHYAEAGMPDKAVCCKAGQQAVTRWAMTEAVVQLQKGLDLLANLPDGDWRRQQELNLLRSLGRALFVTKGYAAPAAGENLRSSGRFG
jgi:hypothetical protein